MAELRRSLGYWTIIALAVSSIMGTGLFYGAGIAPKYAGNASLLSWFILSLFALYIAACFGELSAMFPNAGGVYEFCKQAYGRFFSFIIGWVAWLVGNITTPLLVVAGVNLIFPSGSSYLIYKVVVAVVIIIILNYIAFLGVDASAAVLIFLTLITFTVILSVAIPGIWKIDPLNYTPFFNFGMTGVFVAIFFVAETFFGWESVTFLSEETTEPEKVIPKSLIIGTIITSVLVLLINLVSLGIMPWQKLVESSMPFMEIASRLHSGVALKLIAIGIFATLINSAFGGIMTMPRLLLALSRDRLFLSHFSKVHPRTNTPYKGIIFQTVVSLIILAMGFGTYELLLGLLLPLGLVMYVFVLLSVTILRYKQPEKIRPFKVLFGKIGPILSVIFIIIFIFLLLKLEMRLNNLKE